MVFDSIEKRPEALAIDPFSVQGKTGRLKSVQVPVNSSGMATEITGNVCSGFSHSERNERLYNFPLTRQLVPTSHVCLFPFISFSSLP